MTRRVRNSPWPLGFVVLVVLLFSSCGQRITQVIIKDSPTTVGPDWVEIPLPKRVAANWDAQQLRVIVSTKFEESTHPWGIKLADGSIVVPEFALATDGEANYDLHLEGFADSNTVEILFGSDIVPKGSRFAQLRARCSKPIVLSRVEWISYMPENTKTGYP
jgi:hypothetical protein